MSLLRAFHNLGQHPPHVLRVKEKDQRPMRPDPRLPQHAHALALEPGLRLTNIRHLETDMMLPPKRILGEKAKDRRLLPQRLDQLDLAIGRIDKADADALSGEIERIANCLLYTSPSPRDS